MDEAEAMEQSPEKDLLMIVAETALENFHRYIWEKFNKPENFEGFGKRIYMDGEPEFKLMLIWGYAVRV